MQGLGFRVWGLGFRVCGLGLRVWGLGSRAFGPRDCLKFKQILVLRVSRGFGLGVQDLGSSARVQGFCVGVYGLGSEVFTAKGTAGMLQGAAAASCLGRICQHETADPQS